MGGETSSLWCVSQAFPDLLHWAPQKMFLRSQPPASRASDGRGRLAGAELSWASRRVVASSSSSPRHNFCAVSYTWGQTLSKPVPGCVQAAPWAHSWSSCQGRGEGEGSCFHEQLLGSIRERTQICNLRRMSAGKWKLFVSFVSSWQWLLKTAVFGQTEIHSMVEDGTHLCGGAKQPHQFVPPIPTSAAMGLHLLGYWCQAGMSCPWRNPPVQMQVGTVCDSSWCAKATTGGHELAWKGRRDDLAGPCRCSLGNLSLHLRCFVGTVLYRPAQ